MSKFFYHGKASNLNERGSGALKSNKTVRLGTPKAPAIISVQTLERKLEIESLLQEKKWHGEVTVNADQDENIRDLEILQNKTPTVSTQKLPNRNDACPCGSQKKFKKCCGA